MWDTIVIGVNACGNSVRDKYHCRKRFDDIRSKLKKKIQDQRVHATGTGGGPTPQRLILTPLEELLRPKLLTVVVEGLAGDRDIGIYPSQFPAVAPGGHVSPEMEQVSSPGSASSTLLEEHHGDEDDEDDATEETEIQSCDHEEVPIETVVPPNRPSTSTYDAIVASEGKIVDAENRRHSDMMTVLERMIGLQEETVSQLAHLHRVFIEVPKQLQKINTSFEALVVQQTQANYWRMTNVPQFNTSQPGSVHAGQFSPHSSDIHSPGPNVTGQVADIAVQVPDDILPLPSVQIQQQTPTKEATKTKQDTHETDQPSLVQCLPTCSHVSLGTSPVREQSLPKSPVASYQEFADVFDKKQAEELPPHRPYDCEIDMLQGAIPPSGRTYPLSEPETKAMREYILEMLQHGFIQRNYDVGNWELLAMKIALEEWRHLLEGATSQITILTDPKNLEYIEGAKRLRTRQERWALFFTRFNFVISYRPRSKNVKADTLSRQFCPDNAKEIEQGPIIPSS
ncbi:uncharacterized protein LOC142498014 [Ascaphus truei]|uniref:uncharacterized protein LOC142498014 n=1 Tax=Ascaphus truei TaxID=8439 RepID=UPI003F5953A8